MKKSVLINAGGTQQPWTVVFGGAKAIESYFMVYAKDAAGCGRCKS